MCFPVLAVLDRYLCLLFRTQIVIFTSIYYYFLDVIWEFITTYIVCILETFISGEVLY